jgi:hypothetical protein
MVKSPKIRHSKSLTEPVTIELAAGDVSRISPESEAAKPKVEAASPSSGPKDMQNAAKPQADRPAAGRPDAGKAPAGQFGREGSSKPTPPPPPPRKDTLPPPPRGGRGGALAAGLAGAAVALAVAGGGAWYAGWLPPSNGTVAPASDEITTLKGEIAALRDNIAALRANPVPPSAEGGDSAALADVNARVEGLATSIEDLRGQLGKLGEAAGNAPAADNAAMDELRTGLATLEGKVAALPTDGGSAAETLKADVARLDAGLRSASDAAAAATEAARQASARSEEVAKSIEALSTKVAEQDKTPAIALAIAASSLKAAVERGTPFTTELDTYASLAPDAPEIAALRELAAGGAPTRVEIGRGMNAAADAMVQAGRTVDPNAGFLDRLWQSAQSLIKVRPVGEIEGTGVPATIARIEAAVNAGDYEKALAEYETLPADAKAAGAAFMAMVRTRLAADQSVDKALAVALRA